MPIASIFNRPRESSILEILEPHYPHGRLVDCLPFIFCLPHIDTKHTVILAFYQRAVSSRWS